MKDWLNDLIILLIWYFERDPVLLILFLLSIWVIGANLVNLLRSL